MNPYLSPFWKWRLYWYIPSRRFERDHKCPSWAPTQFKNPFCNVSNKWLYFLNIFIKLGRSHYITVQLLLFFLPFFCLRGKIGLYPSTAESTCALGLLPFGLYWNLMPSVTSSPFYLVYFPSSASSPSAHNMLKCYLSYNLWLFHSMASQYQLKTIDIP